MECPTLVMTSARKSHDIEEKDRASNLMFSIIVFNCQGVLYLFKMESIISLESPLAQTSLKLSMSVFLCLFSCVNFCLFFFSWVFNFFFLRGWLALFVSVFFVEIMVVNSCFLIVSLYFTAIKF